MGAGRRAGEPVGVLGQSCQRAQKGGHRAQPHSWFGLECSWGCMASWMGDGEWLEASAVCWRVGELGAAAGMGKRRHLVVHVGDHVVEGSDDVPAWTTAGWHRPAPLGSQVVTQAQQ